MNRNIHHLREDYQLSELLKDKVPASPIALFQDWFEKARSAKILEPNTMTLATAGANGRPSARIVLLKGYNDEGFIFYTNYDSRKGQQIAENPFVSAVFLWKELERQVRIEGAISKLPDSASETYYQSRPKGSQIGAWVSPQSQVIADRWELEEQYERLELKYKEKEVLPKPPHWGGYIILPTMIEFWQGRSSRLHDRIRYESIDRGWNIDRLAP